ncbi:MAG: multifunctional CCA tRNA nucleotidyl transferase/2'3'-cyclic phosphodiesterase/2'nucleotidase/phosphatase [Neisseriaceae bacterium]
MEIYLVGGAVRDQLLGMPIQDQDWVVVGSTIEEMLEKGFKPVGKSFPVFLHPKTKEEYALARTEKKIGQGYHGFVFHADPAVTLEQDLLRRDLTINAMAIDRLGNLIDPYHGREDLKAGLLRHVSPAFIEDPLRLLRLARFVAKLNFKVHESTLELARSMVRAGEINSLSWDRVSGEFIAGLAGLWAGEMLGFLSSIGLLEQLFPNLNRVVYRESARLLSFLDSSLVQVLDATDKLAILLIFFLPEDNPADFLQSLRLPKRVQQYLLVVQRIFSAYSQGKTVTAETVLVFLQQVDAFRQPQRLDKLLKLLPVLLVAKSASMPILSYDLRGVLEALKGLHWSEQLLKQQGQPIAELVRQRQLKEIERYFQNRFDFFE